MYVTYYIPSKFLSLPILGVMNAFFSWVFWLHLSEFFSQSYPYVRTALFRALSGSLAETPAYPVQAGPGLCRQPVWPHLSVRSRTRRSYSPFSQTQLLLFCLCNLIMALLRYFIDSINIY